LISAPTLRSRDGTSRAEINGTLNRAMPSPSCS
jgi:hypothetical protein